MCRQYIRATGISATEPGHLMWPDIKESEHLFKKLKTKMLLKGQENFSYLRKKKGSIFEKQWTSTKTNSFRRIWSRTSLNFLTFKRKSSKEEIVRSPRTCLKNLAAFHKKRLSWTVCHDFVAVCCQKLTLKANTLNESNLILSKYMLCCLTKQNQQYKLLKIILKTFYEDGELHGVKYTVLLYLSICLLYFPQLFFFTA